MRVLAIDPGYDRLGLAVLEKESGQKETLLYSECFTTNKQDEFGTRLVSIGEKVASLISEYGPEALSIENLFFENNQKTAMRVAETRGAILYLALSEGLSVMELTPLQVKSAVTGDGRSDKTHVAKMVSLLLPLPKRKIIDDEYDAIALGLAFFAYYRSKK